MFVGGIADLTGFISYYPLKQGLKRFFGMITTLLVSEFISYYPLKQGLKPSKMKQAMKRGTGFISYYPLKQGLKHALGKTSTEWHQDLYPTIH